MGGLITRREERADYQPVPQLPSEVINFMDFSYRTSLRRLGWLQTRSCLRSPSPTATLKTADCELNREWHASTLDVMYPYSPSYYIMRYIHTTLKWCNVWSRSGNGAVCSDITLNSSVSLVVTVNMTSCLPNITTYVHMDGILLNVHISTQFETVVSFACWCCEILPPPSRVVWIWGQLHLEQLRWSWSHCVSVTALWNK